MANKKAFEIQFNWLFVLVAGAAILVFFTAVVVKQKNISETSTKTTVLKSLESIITGASVSTDTTTVIDIPESSMDISCGRISVEKVSKQYQNLILFAPSTLRGDKLITQTLAFNIPYRATNFLYVTNPQVRYILVGNNPLAKETNKSLSSKLKKDFLDYNKLSTIKNENNQKVRLVFFGDINDVISDKFKEMPDFDVTAIKVDGSNEKGTIQFYQKKQSLLEPKGSSSYLTKTSLLGAIFSDTLEAYECNMKNALMRLNIVNDVYIDKTTRLKDLIGQGRCEILYDSALAQLNKIKSSSSLGKSSEIVFASEELSKINKELQRFSCPLIY